MYKFVTIRCRCCNSVICNLPEKEFKKLKLIDLVCEDCKCSKKSKQLKSVS